MPPIFLGWSLGLSQFAIARTTIKFLKWLLSKHFKNFIGSGLSAKRCSHHDDD